MTIAHEIKKKIKREKIKPKARWRFYALNFGWWLLFAFLFIIISIAFGVIIYMIKGADWEVARLVATGIWGRLLLVIPSLWLLLIVITTFIAVWEFRKTRKGYRYDAVVIFGVVLIGSVVLGSVVYASGLGERLDSLLTDNMPFYKGRLHQQMDLWDHADKGLLIGRAVDLNEEEITLHAPRGIEWVVDITDIDSTDFKIGDVLKIDGKAISAGHFKAITLQLLEMNRFMGNHKPPMKHFMSPIDDMRSFERFPMRHAY